MNKPIIRLIAMPFGVFTVFILSGFSIALVAEELGYWPTPVAGFFSAISVVLSGYIFAPYRKLFAAFCWFIVGLVVSWDLIGLSFYPESYGAGLAYRQTYVPIAVTYLGGGIGLLICWFSTKSQT